MKKSNPYCIEDVMNKHNISREEAIQKIAELKKKTTITLENLISKYGEEEGRKRFDSFRSKSAHTKEKYMEKFGENWEKHWTTYLASKSCSLQKFIERYGEEIGKQKYEEYQNKKSFSNTLKGYIEKYGEVEGTKKYELVTKKRNVSSLSCFLERYGQEEGLKRYEEVNAKKDSSSLKHFCQKYGDEEGKKRYDIRLMQTSPLFCAIKKEYGEAEAIKAYSQYAEKKFDVVSKDYESIAKHKTNIKNKRLSKGPVSKESNLFFKTLEIALDRKLQYGKKSDELKLSNIDTIRYFCYDCLDEASKTIIEFHGVAWHPKEGETDWCNPFGTTYEKIRDRDVQKKQLAESNGYQYIVVYSDEVKTVDKRELKINYLKEVINGNCKKN